jgi:hypothetical protein
MCNIILYVAHSTWRVDARNVEPARFSLAFRERSFESGSSANSEEPPGWVGFRKDLSLRTSPHLPNVYLRMIWNTPDSVLEQSCSLTLGAPRRGLLTKANWRFLTWFTACCVPKKRFSVSFAPIFWYWQPLEVYQPTWKYFKVVYIRLRDRL